MIVLFLQIKKKKNTERSLLTAKIQDKILKRTLLTNKFCEKLLECYVSKQRDSTDEQIYNMVVECNISKEKHPTGKKMQKKVVKRTLVQIKKKYEKGTLLNN